MSELLINPKKKVCNPTTPSLLHKRLAFWVWFLPVYLSLYTFTFIIINVLLITFYYCQANTGSPESRNEQKKKGRNGHLRRCDCVGFTHFSCELCPGEKVLSVPIIIRGMLIKPASRPSHLSGWLLSRRQKKKVLARM